LVEIPAPSWWYLCIAMLVLWCTALARRPALRTVLGAGLVALLTWDLFCALLNPFKHPFHDASVFDQAGATFDFIKSHQGLDRTSIQSGWAIPEAMAKQGTLRGISSIPDYEPLSLNRYDKFFHLIEPERVHRPNILTFPGGLFADPATPGFRLL